MGNLRARYVLVVWYLRISVTWWIPSVYSILYVFEWLIDQIKLMSKNNVICHLGVQPTTVTSLEKATYVYHLSTRMRNKQATNRKQIGLIRRALVVDTLGKKNNGLGELYPRNMIITGTQHICNMFGTKTWPDTSNLDLRSYLLNCVPVAYLLHMKCPYCV